MRTVLVRKVAIAATGALLLFATTALAADSKKPRALPTAAREFKGDLDGMIERRAIRMLVPYGRTLYFNDKGRERGISAELARDLAQSYRRDQMREVVRVPACFIMLMRNPPAAGLDTCAALPPTLQFPEPA